MLEMKNIRGIKLLFYVFFISNFAFSQVDSVEVNYISVNLKTIGDAEIVLDYLDNPNNIQDTNAVFLATRGLEFSHEKGLILQQVEFLIARAKVYKYRNEPSKLLLDALSALNYIEENDLGLNLRSRANFLVAYALQEMEAYNEAIEVRKGQLSWAKVNGKKGRYLNHLQAIGSLYYQLGVYDSAIVYFNKSYSFIKEKQMGEGQASALNNIGLGYYQQGKLDSSKYFFELAYALFHKGKTQTDSLMKGLVGGNLSQCYPSSTNKDLIKKLLNAEILITKKYNYVSTLPEAYVRLSNLYTDLGEYPMALLYIDTAYQLVTEQAILGSANKLHLEVLGNYIKLLEKVGDTKKGLKLAQEYIRVNENLYGEEATKSLTLSKISYQVSSVERELERNKEAVLRLKKEEQFSRLRAGLILTVGISLVLIALIVILKMRTEEKKKKVIEEYSKQILEKTIANKNQMLTQAMLNLTRKKEFAKELLERLKKDSDKMGGIDSSVQMFISNEINMDESLFKMDKYISELDESFFTKLELKYPQLTSSDLKLCGLIRMDLSNKELAIIMNITPDSMKTRKTRLSKKMNLPSGTILFEELKKM